MIDLTIETMRHSHIPGVMEIERDAFGTPWTPGMFREEVEDNQMSRAFVALHEGRVVGYYVSWFLRDDVHLLNIAVASQHRRQGLGRALLDHLLDSARREHKETVTLEVRQSNEAAIHLYRSAGFEPIGVRPGYYQDDRENALLMARSIARRREAG